MGRVADFFEIISIALYEKVIRFILKIGEASIFIINALLKTKKVLFSKNKFVKRNLYDQFYSFGVKSFALVLIVSTFTGMVLMIQMVPSFAKFKVQNLVGGAVGVAIVRELGPTLTAIIIAGRLGSAIAAELGSMFVTEQVDALTVMGINPIEYLVTPRILSGIIMLPLLTILADFLGIMGSYFIGVHFLGIVSGSFWSNLSIMVKGMDIIGGLIKPFFFGMIITGVATYKGLHVKGGSSGIGIATTAAVVESIMLILICNFFISAIIFG